MTVVARPALAGSRPRNTADVVLATCGISVAAASITFAGYMLAFGPAGPRVDGEFSVFAQFDRRTRLAAAHDEPGRSETRQATVPEPSRDGRETPGIDFLPTGSVAAAATAPHTKGDTPQAAARLSGFVLRDVFDGAAVVQSGDRLSVVRPGSILAGAGAVRAIQQDGRDWVVLTDRGAIMRPPPAAETRDRTTGAENLPSRDIGLEASRP